jgi:hypothetical protein
MFGWEVTPHSFFEYWWIVPLIFMILCIACCLSGRHRTGKDWCCGRRDRVDEVEELRKEVQALRQRLGSTK